MPGRTVSGCRPGAARRNCRTASAPPCATAPPGRCWRSRVRWSRTSRRRADALVNAGLELAAYRLTAQPEATRPTSGTFNARVGAGRVSVTFRSEAARVDLNAAPKPMLVGLMTALGVSAMDAPVYADRILA